MKSVMHRVHDAIRIATDRLGWIDKHKVRTLVKPTLSQDEREYGLDVWLDSLTMKAGKTGRKEGRKRSEAERVQADMFPGLHYAYPVGDGETFVMTDSLTREQFRQIIALRKVQLAADSAHLRYLEETFAKAEMIWGDSPALTFGDVKLRLAAIGAAE